jgi:sulfur carrier protein
VTITVNGTEQDVEEGTTVGVLVDAHAAHRRGVAVAVDEHVVARTRWDEMVLPPGCRVEVVAAAQGG